MLCLPGILLTTLYLCVLRQSKQGVGLWGLAPAGSAVLLDMDKSVNRPLVYVVRFCRVTQASWVLPGLWEPGKKGHLGPKHRAGTVESAPGPRHR